MMMKKGLIILLLLFLSKIDLSAQTITDLDKDFNREWKLFSSFNPRIDGVYLYDSSFNVTIQNDSISFNLPDLKGKFPISSEFGMNHSKTFYFTHTEDVLSSCMIAYPNDPTSTLDIMMDLSKGEIDYQYIIYHNRNKICNSQGKKSPEGLSYISPKEASSFFFNNASCSCELMTESISLLTAPFQEIEICQSFCKCK